MMTNSERRVKFRVGLSKLYLPSYDFLCKVLPPEWAPFAGLRTIDEQETLYQIGRTQPGKIITNARGGMSPHNYGAATDWTIFEKGQPIWPDSKDLRWKVYRAAIAEVGGRWGGDWNGNGIKDSDDFDRPHNELMICCPWFIVWREHQADPTATEAYIEKRLSKRSPIGQTPT